MSLRVVLYAEGTGELGGGLPPAPGTHILDDDFGPAHHLVRRVLVVERRLHEKAVLFQTPLRHKGRLVRGSDLHVVTTLRQLLTYADPRNAPRLAIVLVDEDAKPDRYGVLDQGVQGLLLPAVIGVAVREFETWLIADPHALRRVFGPSARLDAAPESLPPTDAKQLLNDWCAEIGRGSPSDSREIRSTLAQAIDLDVTAARRPAFATFRDLVGRALPRAPR